MSKVIKFKKYLGLNEIQGVATSRNDHTQLCIQSEKSIKGKLKQQGIDQQHTADADVSKVKSQVSSSGNRTRQLLLHGSG